MKGAYFSTMAHTTCFWEAQMARPSKLSLLSVDALFKLRDDVAAALSRKADALKKELAALGSDYAEVGRIAIYGKKKRSLKGRKVAPKYRSKKDPKLTWAGRGATPVWMRDEMKAKKRKKEAFLIK
jgi:DNA-binding protein H-NS